MVENRDKPARTIDTSGQCCPVPMMETNRAIKSLQPGEVLEVVATDIGSKMDIPAWCGRTGHELVRMEEEGKTFRYYVRKRR
ncbi:MAG: sulfurtransferase TusA family protein [Sulfuricaulis sp.]